MAAGWLGFIEGYICGSRTLLGPRTSLLTLPSDDNFLRTGIWTSIWAVLHEIRLCHRHILLVVGFASSNSQHYSIADLLSNISLTKKALRGIVNGPIAFYDTSPLSRIMNHLSKGPSPP